MTIECRRHVPLALFVIAAQCVLGQNNAPGTAFPAFVRGNELIGRKLLANVHANQPDRNVVVSPVSISLVLASLQAGARWGSLREEIGTAFEWGANAQLSIPARMLLAAFDDSPSVREGVRVENVFLYREPNYFSDNFVSTGRKYFGMMFVSNGASKPDAAGIRRARRRAGPLPTVSGRNAVVISSGIHLSTAWRGNTFALHSPFASSFVAPDDMVKSVETLASELEYYPHADTKTFEAVALPCYSAYMIVVMPKSGKDIRDLERELVASPDALDAALTRSLGMVTMPTWHIRIESEFRPSLEQMGIRQVFRDLGKICTVPKSVLTEVKQAVDLHVDQVGIRADAETAVGSYPGGIMAAQNIFRMVVNRPFLFLIRDQTTNALLFIGAVMDPTRT